MEIARRWLKVGEAAVYLGINPKSLYSLLSSGEIGHSRRKGIGIRVCIEKLDEYLREGEIRSVKQQIEGKG